MTWNNISQGCWRSDLTYGEGDVRGNISTEGKLGRVGRAEVKEQSETTKAPKGEESLASPIRDDRVHSSQDISLQIYLLVSMCVSPG